MFGLIPGSNIISFCSNPIEIILLPCPSILKMDPKLYQKKICPDDKACLEFPIWGISIYNRVSMEDIWEHKHNSIKCLDISRINDIVEVSPYSGEIICINKFQSQYSIYYVGSNLKSIIILGNNSGGFLSTYLARFPTGNINIIYANYTLDHTEAMKLIRAVKQKLVEQGRLAPNNVFGLWIRYYQSLNELFRVI